jgi:hypothetical protein
MIIQPRDRRQETSSEEPPQLKMDVYTVCDAPAFLATAYSFFEDSSPADGWRVGANE